MDPHATPRRATSLSRSPTASPFTPRLSTTRTWSSDDSNPEPAQDRPQLPLVPPKSSIAVRPSTPLNFLLSLSRSSSLPGINAGVPIHRRVRSSVDSERPRLVVDQSKGRVPLDAQDTAERSRLGSPPKISPISQSTLPPETPRRMGAIREMGTKLASISGLGRDRGTPSDHADSRRDKGTKRNIEFRFQERSSPLTLSAPMSTDLLHELGPAQPAIVKPDDPYPLSSQVPPTQPLVVPSMLSESTSAELSQLLSPNSAQPTGPPFYAPSLTSTQSSSSNRDRVLGVSQGIPDPGHEGGTGSRIFLPASVAAILPVANDIRPFTAWDKPQASHRGRRPNVRLSRIDSQGDETEGWKETPNPRGLPKGKRVWVDALGEEVSEVYKVGWERGILDLESRLHETMWDIAGESHTFARFDEAPRAVLDLGTGTGLWPISQALSWPTSTFVGLDLVPCQTDLSFLARAERAARSTSTETAVGLGMWGSIEDRITWDRGSFLDTLPYDTGVFDMVHIRFIGLAVPESKWGDLLEEAARVLKTGGTLEIVEISYTLPPTAPASLRNSFASLLLSNVVHPLPLLPLRFSLPSIPSVVSGAAKPTFEKTWDKEYPVLDDALAIWVRSALDYKGTRIIREGERGRFGARATQVLVDVDAARWTRPEGGNHCKGSGQSIWAWVVKKR